MNQQSVDPSDLSGSEDSQHGTSGAGAMPTVLSSSTTQNPAVAALPSQVSPTGSTSHSEQAHNAGTKYSASTASAAPVDRVAISPASIPVSAETPSNVSSVFSPDSYPSDAPSHAPNHPPILPSMIPSVVRQRVQHSFDVFADQILSLRDIALKREFHTGLHTRLGDLVQEALDQFITRETRGTEQVQRAIEAPGQHREQHQQAVPREWEERATAASADEHEENQGSKGSEVSQEPYT